MSPKILIVIALCVLLVGSTVFVMVALNVHHAYKEGEDLREDLSNDMSLNSNPTESEIDSTTAMEETTSEHFAINSFAVIDAPIPCDKGFRYVAKRGKCEKSL